MGDAVLFACGGGASHVVSDHPPSAMPVVIVNPPTPGPDRPELWDSAVKQAVDGIGDSLDGVRIAFIYVILGGDLGRLLMSELTVRAKIAGCRVVLIAGIPMAFEKARRAKALAEVPEIREAGDRLLVMDGETVARLNSDVKADSSFRLTAHSLSFAMDNLAHLAEGPFFSTLTERAYTFAYVTELDPGDAVHRALNASVFPSHRLRGAPVVTVSSGFGEAPTEKIVERVVAETGMLPDIVERPDSEDSKFLVFLPVEL